MYFPSREFYFQGDSWVLVFEIRINLWDILLKQQYYFLSPFTCEMCRGKQVLQPGGRQENNYMCIS